MFLRNHNEQLLRWRDDATDRMDSYLLDHTVNRRRQALEVRLLSRLGHLLHQRRHLGLDRREFHLFGLLELRHQNPIVFFGFCERGLILHELLTLPGQFLRFVDPLPLGLQEIHLRDRLMVEEPLVGVRPFSLHGNRRFQPVNILSRLIKPRLALVNQMLRRSCSGLILGHLIPKELPLQ